jgi:hypothetical protein
MCGINATAWRPFSCSLTILTQTLARARQLGGGCGSFYYHKLTTAYAAIRDARARSSGDFEYQLNGRGCLFARPTKARGHRHRFQ